jgi:7-cyano-7-deazaguanine synthase in queuosine biosynthesis
MSILIPWSGGLDSTKLLIDALAAGHTVYPVYFECKNNVAKTKKEKSAIKKIHKSLMKRYKDTLTDIKFPVTIFLNVCTEEVTLKQPPLWVLGIIYSITKDIDEVHIGYVQNDCAVSWIQEIKKLYQSYKPFTSLKKLPKLKFPLIKEYKNSIWKSLEHYDFERQNTHFCEYGADCGECEPCKRYKYDGLFEVYNRNKPLASAINSVDHLNPIEETIQIP